MNHIAVSQTTKISHSLLFNKYLHILYVLYVYICTYIHTHIYIENIRYFFLCVFSYQNLCFENMLTRLKCIKRCHCVSVWLSLYHREHRQRLGGYRESLCHPNRITENQPHSQKKLIGPSARFTVKQQTISSLHALKWNRLMGGEYKTQGWQRQGWLF